MIGGLLHPTRQDAVAFAPPAEAAGRAQAGDEQLELVAGHSDLKLTAAWIRDDVVNLAVQLVQEATHSSVAQLFIKHAREVAKLSAKPK